MFVRCFRIGFRLYSGIVDMVRACGANPGMTNGQSQSFKSQSQITTFSSHELQNGPPWAFISALYQKLFGITPNNYGRVWCDGPMGPVLGPARTSGPDLGRSWDQTGRLVLVLVLVGPGPAQPFFWGLVLGWLLGLVLGWLLGPCVFGQLD